MYRRILGFGIDPTTITWNKQPFKASIKKPFKFHVSIPYFAGKDNKTKVYKLLIGAGAGYINGATLYVAINARPSEDYHGKRPKLQIGLTQNANKVPLP